MSRITAGTALAGLLAAAGAAHFVIPRFFDSVVPEVLPGSARAWTYGSGVVEIATAAVVAVPRTRRVGAGLAALLFVAVFPANIKMAIDWSDRSLPERLAAYGRLPLQIPLVIWALRVRGRRVSGDVVP
jgi:uncharacterized membrane protein